jgi:hypothetical protein
VIPHPYHRPLAEVRPDFECQAYCSLVGSRSLGPVSALPSLSGPAGSGRLCGTRHRTIRASRIPSSMSGRQKNLVEGILSRPLAFAPEKLYTVVLGEGLGKKV